MVHGAVSCLTVATNILKPQKAWGEDFSIFLVALTELAASKTLAEMKPSMAACFVQKQLIIIQFPNIRQKKLIIIGFPNIKICNIIYIYITEFLIYDQFHLD